MLHSILSRLVGFGRLVGFRSAMIGVLALALALSACHSEQPSDVDAAGGSASTGGGSEAGTSGTVDDGLDGRAGAGGDGGAAPTEQRVYFSQVAFSRSPLFFVAYDEQGYSVAFTATKDENGNPERIDGIALVHGERFVWYQVDELGRPTAIVTPEESIAFHDYTRRTVTVEVIGSEGARKTRKVAIDPAALDDLVPPPAFDFMEKSATGDFFVSLIEFADTMVGLGKNCGFTKFLRGPVDSIINLGKCFVETLDLTDRQRFEGVLAAIRALADAQSVVSCLGGLGYATEAGIVAVTGAGAPVAIALAARAAPLLLDCPDAVDAIEAWFIKDSIVERFKNGEFNLRTDDALVVGVRSQITVRLAVKGEPEDNVFPSVMADLSAIGGPPNASFTRAGEGGAPSDEQLALPYQWSGEVTPPKAGCQFTYLRIGSSDAWFAGCIEVSPPPKLTVTLKATPASVGLGESVVVQATVEGGTAPYESAWAIRDQSGPENTLQIEDRPPTRSHYEFAVQDRSRSLPYFATAEVWVDVCGDRECSSSESCEADCPAGNGGAGAGGTSGVGGGASGGAAGSGGSGPTSGSVGPAADPAFQISGAPNPGSGGLTQGDPHLKTFDGLSYDLQAVGELTLVSDATDELEVQVRTKGWHGSVAVNIGVAARVGADRVAFYAPAEAGSLGPSTLNGKSFDFPNGRTNLVGGGRVYRKPGLYVVEWPDGTQLRIAPASYHLSVQVFGSDARREHFRGILGDFNGTHASDLVTRQGVAMPSPVAFGELYHVFAESWRITQANSLFDYDAGQDTETFTNRAFPRRLLRASDLDPAIRAQAQKACEEAGVVDPAWMEACILDVGTMSDLSFARLYSSPPAVKAALSVTPPPVLDADHQGGLSADSTLDGTLAAGAKHSFTFSVNQGAGVQIRLVDATGNSFVPGYQVFNPTGVLAASISAQEVAYGSFTAGMTGTYTIVISDASGLAGVQGNYRLHVATAPGANEHGLLAPGAVATGSIEKGDLDSWTFTASEGEGIQLRVTDVAGGALVPAISVYNPSGGLTASTSNGEVAYTSFSAGMTGTYTVVVYDWSTNVASTGDYKLYFTKGPGANEHGLLTPGGVASGTIEKGDLDSFTFTVKEGEGVQLRVTDIAGGALVPAISVYNPSGGLTASTSNGEVAYTSFSAGMTGTYTVVVYDWSTNVASTGDYNLYFTKAPGANEHGPLTPGVQALETIDKGDLDSFTLALNQGQRIQFLVTDVAGGPLVPAISVYNPQGGLTASTSNATAATTTFTAGMTGIYTLVIYDWSSNAAASGQYSVLATFLP